ncbi:AI-2E family transporter [Leuconostoc litchii]|uniref:AI-2E family transporter n=1 Tax=Leuconostoc litchii TaxID=1981069 RepID=A0A652NE15_9LACO|nr:AI-2E family transporter [Leuconostoc litchii]TYC46518.1 AI-2E family transporter [Leuconostoc litchii]GMA70165.1 AI-2E family transporter [Leuconostoc litchii]
MNLLETIQKRIPYRYGVLLVIILLIIGLKQFMPLLLLTIIFAYLAMSVAKPVAKFLKISRTLSIALVYIVFVTVVALAIEHGASTLIQQIKSMVTLAMRWNWQDNTLLQDIYKNVNQYTSFFNSNHLISESLSQLNHIGHIIYQLVLALLFSFIFSMTYPKLRLWSMNFLHSPFKKFFGEFYIIVHRFIIILGKLFEIQLIICMINTTLMFFVLTFLHFPYLLGFTILIFVLGLIPVFGVIISLIPLTITAFIIGDWNTVIIIIIAVALIHLFESYFLHPHLMSQKTHMPILIILLNLIIMEHFFSVWGLIIGLPILTFLLDFFQIQKFNQ